MEPSNEILLQVRNIHKSFPGVQALRDVSLDIRAGEIHAIVGENGSGKSTLLKIVAGIYRAERGGIFVRDRLQESWNPVISQKNGVSAIHQELSLFPDLSVAENIFIGHESFTRSGIVRWKSIRRETGKLLGYLGVRRIDPAARVDTLSIAQRQIVEILKALAAAKVRILLMDEPTSALTAEEVSHLFRLMKKLRDDGVGIIFVSHRLEEVLSIADRVTVLRDGEFIGSSMAAALSRDELIRMMIGRDLSYLPMLERNTSGERVLEVRNLGIPGVFRGVSFDLHRGEVLGIFGLVGAGRTELAETLFGVRKAERGEILLSGRPVGIRSTRRALDLGIGLIPEDRGTEGLVLPMSITQNISLPILERIFPLRFLRGTKEAAVSAEVCGRLDVKFGDLRDAVDSLSGGNKQKIVLAKWLLAKAKVLIFDEPTKGIDVGAKDVIHSLMNDILREGVGIIMISSELPEILKMSDRILVMAKGAVAGLFPVKEATQDKIMRCASLMDGTRMSTFGVSE